MLSLTNVKLTGTILRTIVNNLVRNRGIPAVLRGAVTNSIDEVGLSAEADRINTTTEVIGQIQHVGDTDLL